MRSNIEAPLAERRQYVDVARAYQAVADAVFPRIGDAIDAVHRHRLQAIGRRYSEVSAPTSALNVVQLAVGFADLAGYTGLWQELELSELALDARAVRVDDRRRHHRGGGHCRQTHR